MKKTELCGLGLVAVKLACVIISLPAPGVNGVNLYHSILLNVTVTNTEATHYTLDTPGGLCIIPGIYDTKMIPENRIIPLQLDSGFRIYYWVLQENGNFRLIEMEDPK